MHRETKRQILDLLTTLEEAISYLQRNPENNREGLLRDCSLCAKSIVATLRKDSEAHEKHVHLLAQFTGKIKQAQEQIGDLHAFQQALSAAKVKLAFLRRKMEKLATKLEVVFLPYKASMWDSLESIWRAANADPDCDAYVVPIPYYDLNPDHTPAKFHYEGDLYPEDVPVTDYRKYDLPARRPDVIYIHNPYDGCNRVTSVEPAYYSDRLKKYTEMLVYVPYDVVMDEISEHMCQMPGVQNADRVIVQSEKIKRTYEKYMPEEKILALGSPKIDKVLWMQKHPPAMPEEWARIARGRKLVLYNTHLSPLIIDDGSVCRKLRYVFSVFKDRDDVCLLWRPHPLSEATMQAMNSRILQEYSSLIELYKKEQWGIYDDSPDVHRSIALSTAYYGDPSSLVEMYKITAKPLMLQDLEIDNENTENKERFLLFSCGEVDGNVLWTSSNFFNGLFKIDLLTGMSEFIAKFPGEEEKDYLYIDIVRNGGKVYFIPYNANSVMEFDIKDHFMKRYPLCIPGRKQQKEFKFFKGILEKDNIWLISQSCNIFVKFNLITKKMGVFNKWYLKNRDLFKRRDSFVSEAIQVEDCIWCISGMNNLMMKFSLLNYETVFYKIGSENRYYTDMEYDGKRFWLIPADAQSVVCWDPVTKECIEYNDFPTSFEKNEFSLGMCIYAQPWLWIFPCYGTKILKFHVYKKIFSIFSDFPPELQYVMRGQKYSRLYRKKGKIYAFPMKSNMLLSFSEETGKCIGKLIEFSALDLKNIEYESNRKSFVNICEEKNLVFRRKEKVLFLTCEEFCEYIIKYSIKAKTESSNNNKGKCIYEKIFSSVNTV